MAEVFFQFPTYVWVAVLMGVGLVIDAAFIWLDCHQKRHRAVAFKGVASLFFVALAIYGTVCTGSSYFRWLIVVGAAFGTLGDVTLALRGVYPRHGMGLMLAGIGQFFLGHVAYLVALGLEVPERLLFALIPTAILFVPALLFFRRLLDIPKVIEPCGIVYVFAVIAMFAVALVGGILSPRPRTVMFACGACCFMVSDLILCYQFFGRKRIPALSPLLLVLYYVGQMAIALTTFAA